MVLCDFDGTVCETEVLGFIFREFAACGMEQVDRYQRGEIDMVEEIIETFKTISATREEMEEKLNSRKIDEGFLRFMELCEEKGHNLAIVSDGLEWYIEYILRRHGIKGLPLYANKVFFTEEGKRLEFPWFHEEAPRRGVCKSRIVRFYKEQYQKVVYIGDGPSDINAVREADVVFARGWLAEYCRENGVRAQEFDSWNELLDSWFVEVVG
jgi:2,3-diketo-5-methylthio-1-phosphopentane phosphatase